MARSNSRRDYRHFPAAYTQLLEQYEREGKSMRVSMPSLKAAKAAISDMNRFKMFLLAAVDNDKDDYALELTNIFKNLSLRSHSEIDADSGEEHFYLLVDRNPLVAAIEAMQRDEV